MRADTHDGPEQMLHVRGLIHCCSSHVRRSWNSVLQRTAGPYILARPGRVDQRRQCPVIGRDQTCRGHVLTAEFDPLRTSVPKPAALKFIVVAPSTSETGASAT